MTVFTLDNGSGLRATVSDLGPALLTLEVPDKDGKPRDVVLGYADEAGYRNNSAYLGVQVGRCANRIGGASFELDGKTYELPKNDGENSVHSGPDFWFHRTWKVIDSGSDHVSFELVSPDGDQGFPGQVTARVSYRLDGRSIDIVREATCDAPTLINIADHSYFNLNGHDAGSILDHVLTINASRFLPARPDNLPTGEIAAVEGTPWDFREPHTVGERLAEVGGYDHDYVPDGDGYRHMARLVGDESGIVMDVLADTPGIQFYSGNFLAAENCKDGAVYGTHEAVVLEAQYHPDSIHHPDWPQPVTRPGQTYSSRQTYAFPEL